MNPHSIVPSPPAVLGSLLASTGAILLTLTLASAYEPQPDGVFERTNDLAGLIVFEQARRSREIRGADVVFVGDSSCLLGVDFELLSESTSLAVEGLCTLGFVGPAGHAKLLESVLNSSPAPGRVIIALHPLSLDRSQGWDEWTHFVEQYAGVERHPPSLLAALRTWSRELRSIDGIRASMSRVRSRWFEPLVFTPLPGAYGRFYGGRRAFASSLRLHRGGAIDPTTGLSESTDQPLESEPNEASAPRFGRIWPRRPPDDSPPGWLDVGMTPSFVEALIPLRRRIRSHPEIRFSLIMMPVRRADYTVELARNRLRALTRLERELLSDNLGIIETSPSMDDPLFATREHLNRAGRREFTEHLLVVLAAR